MVAGPEVVVKPGPDSTDMHKLTRLSVMVFLAYVGDGLRPTQAQVKERGSKEATVRDQALVERGKYIVEGVAMCERCHTQRDEHGNPDRARWLMGGPTQTQPTYPSPAWAD